jgi:hypothetical protein
MLEAAAEEDYDQSRRTRSMIKVFQGAPSCTTTQLVNLGATASRHSGS